MLLLSVVSVKTSRLKMTKVRVCQKVKHLMELCQLMVNVLQQVIVIFSKQNKKAKVPVNRGVFFYIDKMSSL